jgi:hypothetical protein
MQQLLKTLVLAALLVAGCSSTDHNTSASTTTVRKIEVVADKSGRLTEQSATELAQSSLDLPTGSRVVLGQSVGSAPDAPATTVGLVVRRPDGDTVGSIVSDLDQNGSYTPEDDSGLDPPTYISPDGSARLGVSLFSGTLFSFAATTENSTVTLVVEGSGRRVTVPVSDGVSDTSEAWRTIAGDSGSFSLQWLDAAGKVVDELNGEFHGTVD